MLDYIVAAVGVLGGLAGVFAFALGITRTARLRRREQLFRDALEVLPAGHGSRDIAEELHRAALAEIVSRQLTSPWRTVWPWGVWLIVVGFSAQLWYSVCNYVDSHSSWSYHDLVIEIFGDVPFLFLTVGAVFLMLPQVFYSYRVTAEGRAQVARNFYDGRPLERPRTLSQLQVEATYGQPRPQKASDSSSRGSRSSKLLRNGWSGLVDFVSGLLPGLLAIALGTSIGLVVWTAQNPTQGGAASMERAWSWIPVVAVSVLAPATFLAVLNAYEDVRKHALPQKHPQADLQIVRRGRVRPSRHNLK